MQQNEIMSIYEHAELLVDGATVRSAIQRLAGEITAELENTVPLVLCVMQGGLLFTGQLTPLLPFPLEIGYVHATRYGKNTIGTQLQWIMPPPRNLMGRTVVLLDDILDCGTTLDSISTVCKELGASQVLSAVLVDKRHDRKISPGFRANFTGLEIPDRFVFGFGLDYQGYWRNANGIYGVQGL